MALVASGMTNRQIAEELLISAETVKTHVRHIFTKLGVGNRMQIATFALERHTSEPRP